MNVVAFFDEMNYSDEGKAVRVKTANDLSDRFSQVFARMMADILLGEFLREKSYEDYETDLMDAYIAASRDEADVSDNDFIAHETKVVDEILDNIVSVWELAEGSETYNENRLSGLPVKKGDVPKDVTDILSEDHATMIAVNESLYINNKGEYDTAVTEGYRHHEWLSMEDERVRPTHVEADMQVKPINEPFEVGASLLMFPGDTSLGADAGETINCRCVEIFF